MSVKRTVLVTLRSRTLSELVPWRRGKRDLAMDREVVLTKMKVFSESQKILLTSVSSESKSQNQLESSEQDRENRIQNHELDCGRVTAIFSPLLTPDSEDSGVELPSGANSPSTPLGSERSLALHSRESSCDSGDSEGNLTTDPGRGLCGKDLGKAEGCSVACGSLEENTDECKLRQTQSLSGLDYLNQVCSLMERICGLQDLVLRLQRQLRSESQDRTLDETLDRTLDQDRLAALLQRCTCGAAHLVFPEVQQSTTGSLVQDLRTRPGSTQRVYSSKECESAPWKRSRRRRSWRSCTEDDPHIWRQDSHLHRQPSDSSSSWGRVQDLVKRTRVRSQSRLGPGSFKTSCPQLHRLDPGPAQVQMQSRKSVKVFQ